MLGTIISAVAPSLIGGLFGGGGGGGQRSGGGLHTHDIMQPYIVVYIWKRAS